MAAKEYDILLYGATGFTGKLVATYLDRHSELTGRRWAVAGRTKASLQEVRATLASPTVDVVVCPLSDTRAVTAMVASAHVVITCAGPYSSYDGDKLLGACAEAGVHYLDLSGEGFWQREMVEQYHATAKKSGAKIVIAAGVDSIPSDLGTMLALKALQPTAKEEVRVTGVFTEYSGAFSGGTLHAGAATTAAAKSGRLTREMKHDPYLVVPGTRGLDSDVGTRDGMPGGFQGQLDASYGALFGFFMAPVNACVVRRSLALRQLASRVSYRECWSLGAILRIVWLYGSRGLGYPLRQPINFKPKSGEGPPQWMLEQGAFTIHITAEAAGRSVRTVVAGRGDPGYGATAKMLSEAALCLLFDSADLPSGGGVLTPSTALGEALVVRLAAAEGGKFMKFDSAASAPTGIRSRM